ncbi:MAG: RidA family protein [Planctomycetota bacterium]|jgi:enamine deaminase RidA (YjgF/YER057c/UK114 family)|nr:RidA family protein [Planctomycetota bacterium]
MLPEEKLRQLGLELPSVAAPIANFVNYRRVGEILYLSGQGPRESDGTLHRGKLGRDLTVEDGYRHARQVGLNLLAVAREALGGLDGILEVVKLLGMVNAAPDFTEHPLVINGCSDLFVEVLGRERGAHARTAVGLSSLPGNISVEIEAIMRVDG